MDPIEVILRLQRGLEETCDECGAPLRLVGPLHNPEYAECANGHKLFYVLATEVPPGGKSWDPLSLQEQDIKWYALAFCPLDNLGFDQLRELSRIFDFKDENLLRLRNRLCDGDRHVVVSQISSAQLRAVVAILEKIKIPYEVISGDHVESPGIASGIRSSFDY